MNKFVVNKINIIIQNFDKKVKPMGLASARGEVWDDTDRWVEMGSELLFVYLLSYQNKKQFIKY